MDPNQAPSTQTPVQAPVVPQPVPEPVSPPPAEPQTPSPKKSNKMLFVFAGIIIVAVLVLGAAGYLYYSNSKSSNVSYQAPVTTVPVPTTEVTPTPISQINSSSDLSKVQNEVNSTSESELQNDLDQANSEGNNL